VSKEVALAAALLLHASQTIPLTLAGLADARTLLRDIGGSVPDQVVEH
jgi:hypothetical protein